MNPGGFFRAQDASAWVDLTTNFAFLPGLDTAEHLASLLDHRLPAHLAQTVLHEMTHHWCFNSPVGGVLALLRQRVTHALFSVALRKPIDDYETLCDLVRYEVATEILRPIAEGMALFAEHDAEIAGEHFYSAPLISFINLSGHTFLQPPASRPLMLQRSSLPDRINASLRNMRMGPTGVARKVDLLTTPLASTSSPYLLGYLALKGIWRTQLARGTDFRNPDRFLAYCRSYIFQDFGLVGAILGDEDHEIAIADRIVGHVLNRINRLSLESVADDLAAWDAHEDAAEDRFELLIRPGGIVDCKCPPQRLPGLGVAHEAMIDGTQRLAALTRWLDHRNETDEILYGQKRLFTAQTALRSLMPICSVRVVASEQGGWCSAMAADGSALARLNVLDPGKASGAGFLEYHVVPADNASLSSTYLVLVIETKVVAVRKGEEWGENDDWVVSRLQPFSEQRDLIERSNRLDTSIIADKLDYYNIILEHLRGQYAGLQKNLYLPPASAFYTGADDHERAMSPLMDTGFYDLMEGDGDLLFDLARLSIVAIQPISDGEARTALAEYGGNIEPLLSKLQDIANEQEMHLITRHKNFVFSRI